MHEAWKQTGSLKAVLKAAWQSAQQTRATWQGTYTGTMLSNLQPGLFSENLYWVGNVMLLTAFVVCFFVFFAVVGKRMGLNAWARITLASLAVTLMVQFMPDVGEAFYWFNGGVGNVFIYSLMALAAVLTLRLLDGFVRALWGLIPLAVLLGGGSYGGGLFLLCLSALLLVWLFWKRHPKRFWMLGVVMLFALCFLYSVTAPGNVVRAGVIRYQAKPAKAVAQSLFYGVALMGSYVKLPLLAVTLLLLPAMYSAAKSSPFAFAHPVKVGVLGACLYAAQLTPPLFSIASIGAGRIVNTYYICFVVLWFPYVYYLVGYAARRLGDCAPLSVRRFGALALVCVCLFGIGCLAFKREGDTLYGAQNMSGPSALVSLVTGEAAQYDREMQAREALLNDDAQPVVTLKPLTAVPAVFMDDLIAPNAVYDVRPVLCLYYGKEAINIEGEVDQP